MDGKREDGDIRRSGESPEEGEMGMSEVEKSEAEGFGRHGGCLGCSQYDEFRSRGGLTGRARLAGSRSSSADVHPRDRQR